MKDSDGAAPLQLGGLVFIVSLNPCTVRVIWDGNNQYYALNDEREIVLNNNSNIGYDVRAFFRDMYEAILGAITFSVSVPTSEIPASQVVGIIDASSPWPLPVNPSELQEGVYYAVKDSSRSDYMKLGGIVLIKTLSPFVVWCMTDGNDQYYAMGTNKQIVLNTDSGTSHEVRNAVRDLYESIYGTMTYAEEIPAAVSALSDIVGLIDASGNAPQ